ncbi:MAG: magnesium/cobalt efflux protein [Chromatiales bacterium 21-64-14]|nr:MAG: magnesium/cobalt efflux protein [Chromatiales bacterium 21-64-14]HQU14720.1 HlyC/CorC family transporter [Gammaproteobacteria bacterium]
MDDVPLSVLFGTLVVLILLSAFFSGSETSLMALNRYRLRHLAKAGHPGAVRVSRLLERPDRLIGLILLGNNFVNIVASSLATVIALRLMGEAGIAVAAGLLTLAVLIFSEVAPKTLAALHPERIAYPASFILHPLLRVLTPVVWVVNVLANGLLRLLGISLDEASVTHLNEEELRTVVMEAGAMIPRRHQRMLLSILDLERVTVEDIMVPRNEIIGVDLDDDWNVIVEQLSTGQYTRVPVYQESIDNVIGFLHIRRVLPLIARGEFTHDTLRASVREPTFIPEGTPLNRQLLSFQRQKQRIGLVVDEYGDIQGLATLEDILEEIVGEFTTDPSASVKDVVPQTDGSYLVDGSANVRELNRNMQWHLPTDGPKTLNGLIVEYLEHIPEAGTSLMLADYPMEIVQAKDNVVKKVRIWPVRRRRRGAAAIPGR